METTSTHPLSEGDCWNLFKGIAFKDGLEDADLELVEIGREIVEKCAGVPLAAKTLGALCYRSNKQTWKSVRDSYIWKLPEDQNGILRALKISYHHLPFYLKQCFAYCSLFPKGYKIQRDTLIQLWIAQELIHSFEKNQSLDVIGSEYVEVLMQISFFQELEVDYCGKVIEFEMHDLVHDLAQTVSGVECFTVCKDKEENYHEGVRHLFFNVEIPRSPFETSGVIAKPSNIQTLIFAFNIDFSLDTICSSLEFLRVLQFRNDEMDQLPDSIDRLKHLRYLQIQCPKIKNLPESITNLQNLQVLKLECERLEKLPTKIRNMISLRHIILIPEINLSHMPCELEELQSLETLSHFVVSRDNDGCGLMGLNELTNLRGELEIRNLERVEDAKKVKETNFRTKNNLLGLKLVWDHPVTTDRLRIWLRTKMSIVGLDFEVLEKLEPHPNLKKLEINGYEDVRFPRWMMDCWLSLRNVVSVTLEGCKNCRRLPCFSRLPSLKILTLHSIVDLQYIEDRPDLQSGKEWFSSLTTLEIENCPNLKSWFSVEAQPQLLISFPSLVNLAILKCPKLKSMPLVPSSIIQDLVFIQTTGEVVGSVGVLKRTSWVGVGVLNRTNSYLFTSLECLSILNCEGMESWSSWLMESRLPSLFIDGKILKIKGYRGIKFPRWMMDSSTSLWNVVEIKMFECHQCQQLFPLSHLPSLKILKLLKMDNLQYIEEDTTDLQSCKECFSSLTLIEIRNCPNLESWFPVEAQPQQQHLLISFPCLVELFIIDCPKMKSVPLLPSSGIKKLWLNGTTGDLVQSVGVPNPTNSSLFTSLEELYIKGCEGMESWPNWLVGSHLPSLRTLSIGCTQSLPFLPQEIQHLTALQELYISNYSEEALPEWMVNITSSSLGVFALFDCPNLKILPEWVLRDNTRYMAIYKCPHLMHRYNKVTGEDRHKIAHIRNIYFI